MARQLVSASGHSLVLKEGVQRIGRSPQNDLQLTDPSVSGFHCELEVTPEEVLVRDLDSTNGTFIDGEPVREAGLKPGQILQLGIVQLVFNGEEFGLPLPHVAIPDLPAPETQTSRLLPDGSPSCLNHASSKATLKCIQCEQLFCEACVRILRRSGGKSLIFCPSCSGACAPLSLIPVKPRQKSFLGRLTQTLRMTFSR